MVGALTLFGVSKNQLVNTAYVLRERMLRGQAWAADTPRRITADLKPVLRLGDAVYEVGFLPIVYLYTRPRFIVVEQGVFYAELDPKVGAILRERLTRDYRLRCRYDMHWIHRLYPFERFVLNAAAGAEVHELIEPAGQPVASTSAPPNAERRDYL